MRSEGNEETERRKLQQIYKVSRNHNSVPGTCAEYEEFLRSAILQCTLSTNLSPSLLTSAPVFTHTRSNFENYLRPFILHPTNPFHFFHATASERTIHPKTLRNGGAGSGKGLTGCVNIYIPTDKNIAQVRIFIPTSHFFQIFFVFTSLGRLTN